MESSGWAWDRVASGPIVGPRFRVSVSSLAGNLATFRYVEFLADDACEIVEATLRLPEGRISTHTRHFGTVVGNQCRPSRKVAPIPAPGSGTPDNPVLVLHRP